MHSIRCNDHDILSRGCTDPDGQLLVACAAHDHFHRTGYELDREARQHVIGIQSWNIQNLRGFNGLARVVDPNLDGSLNAQPVNTDNRGISLGINRKGPQAACHEFQHNKLGIGDQQTHIIISALEVGTFVPKENADVACRNPAADACRDKAGIVSDVQRVHRPRDSQIGVIGQGQIRNAKLNEVRRSCRGGLGRAKGQPVEGIADIDTLIDGPRCGVKAQNARGFGSEITGTALRSQFDLSRKAVLCRVGFASIIKDHALSVGQPVNVGVGRVRIRIGIGACHTAKDKDRTSLGIIWVGHIRKTSERNRATKLKLGSVGRCNRAGCVIQIYPQAQVLARDADELARRQIKAACGLHDPILVGVGRDLELFFDRDGRGIQL